MRNEYPKPTLGTIGAITHPQGTPPVRTEIATKQMYVRDRTHLASDTTPTVPISTVIEIGREVK